MGHRPFSELRAKMSPVAQKRSKANAEKILAGMELAELREALQVRQAEMSERMKITQAAVSRLERRSNLQIDSLAGYIRALGGELELRAILPDQIITLTHLVTTKKTGRRREKRAASRQAGTAL
jgi:transcriptional regulator with XRE-family HTH domain